jgi:hypothetical protein
VKSRDLANAFQRCKIVREREFANHDDRPSKSLAHAVQNLNWYRLVCQSIDDVQIRVAEVARTEGDEIERQYYQQGDGGVTEKASRKTRQTKPFGGSKDTNPRP